MLHSAGALRARRKRWNKRPGAISRASGDTMRKLLALIFLVSPLAAFAQDGTSCSSPVFEKRLIAAVATGEAQFKSVPSAKAQAYARCYARTSCAMLTRAEFEMYALSVIT